MWRIVNRSDENSRVQQVSSPRYSLVCTAFGAESRWATATNVVLLRTYAYLLTCNKIRFTSQVAQRVASLGALSSGGLFHHTATVGINMHDYHARQWIPCIAFRKIVRRPTRREVFRRWFWHCTCTRKYFFPMFTFCRCSTNWISIWSHNMIGLSVQLYEWNWRCCGGCT